MDKKFK